MGELKDFESGKNWKGGSVQELIPEPGEGLSEAIVFMHEQLKFYERNDLFFWESEIEERDGKFYFKLRAKSLPPEYYGGSWLGKPPIE